MTGPLTRIRLRFRRKKLKLQERYPQYEIGCHSCGGIKIRP